MSEATERSAFEAWYGFGPQHTEALERNSNGLYVSGWAQVSWEAWRACSELSQSVQPADGPDYVPMYTQGQINQYGQACFDEGRDAQPVNPWDKDVKQAMTDLASRVTAFSAIGTKETVLNPEHVRQQLSVAMQKLNDVNKELFSILVDASTVDNTIIISTNESK